MQSDLEFEMLIHTILHILGFAWLVLLLIFKLRKSGRLYLLMQGKWWSLFQPHEVSPHIYEADAEWLAFIAVIMTLFVLLSGVELHFREGVDFGTYYLYVLVIPYVVFGVALLIAYSVLWYVRYSRKKREARTMPDQKAIQIALEAGRVSEAMRLYKEVNCLNEANVKPALQQVLANWPVQDAIYNATSELLALQRSISLAQAVGVPIIDSLVEASENVLNTLWIFTDRVVVLKRQNIVSPRIQEALDLQEQRIQNLTQAAREAREDLAVRTVKGWKGQDWEGQDILKAQEQLRAIVTASKELMDDSASML